jgi:hypothetical protein
VITKTDLDEVERLCNQVLADIKLVRADRKVNDELAARRAAKPDAYGQWHHDERLRGEGRRNSALKRHTLDLSSALANLRKS